MKTIKYTGLNVNPKRNNFFETFSTAVTKATGSTTAFLIALGIVLAWAISGPVFHYSENWQLVINTGTTIITFLMVFLINILKVQCKHFGNFCRQ